MTIAAAYLVSEGVVLGADSTSTVISRGPGGGEAAVQLFEHSQKVFEVGQSSRLGLCTWGAGRLGETSHRTIAALLAEQLQVNTTVREAAVMLADIAQPFVKLAQSEFVGYYLGGWDPTTHHPGCFRIEIGPDPRPVIVPLQLGTCSFSGMPNIVSRVVKGFDPDLPLKLLHQLKQVMPQVGTLGNFDELFSQAFQTASAPLLVTGYSDLPMSEAIDFIYAYLHVTIKAIKFKFGVRACGGPIEIGFISTDHSFRWVSHKSFASALTEEVEHVR